MKWKLVFRITILLLLFIASPGCDSINNSNVEISEKPVVLVTSTNYDKNSFDDKFPDKTSLDKINSAYGNKYSLELRNAIIEYIKKTAGRSRVNLDILEQCFALCGCRDNEFKCLPSYVEKARYVNNEAWIIQLNWGMGNEGLGHYKVFVIGTTEMDTLYYKGCK